MSAPTPERSILITGCSSGIGLAAARVLKARGWRVVASARRAEDVARLAAEGFDAVRLDLADEASIAAGLEAALAHTGGRLDALFNNGAYGQPGAVEDLSRAALTEQLQTNVIGTQDLGNRVIALMRRQGHGRIAYNSSLLGYVGLRYRGAYVASKFALEGLADCLRLELAGSGIHVSLIEPGPIATRFRANAFAAYQRHIRPEASFHRDSYRAQEARMEKEGAAQPFTLPPEAVVKALVHALESPRPRARYRVTLPAHLFWYLRRLLPVRVLDVLLRQVT